jgi:hypothetical protein
VPAGSNHAVSDYEARVAIVVLPLVDDSDDELLSLAESGKLREASTLDAQRPPHDRGSPARARLIENFVGQCCSCATSSRASSRTSCCSRTSTTTLRKSFRRETELLFADVLREGRPVQSSSRRT